MSHTLKSILNPVVVNKLLDDWLTEDQPAFDLQSLAAPGDISCSIYCKQEMERKSTYQTEGRLSQLCSGVATITRRIKEKLTAVGWTGILAGTRKTTPGFRLPEKFSLLVGGASCHRFDLSQMVMIKDNHVKASGGISKALERVNSARDFTSKIEVECSSFDDAIEAANCGADIIMLDNFTPEDAASAAKNLKTDFPSVLVEVSGCLTEDNVLDFASNCIDVISMSCLVQGYSTIDFSMKVD